MPIRLLRSYRLLIIALILIAFAKAGVAGEFNATVVTSTMESVLDGWYKTSAKSGGPVINSVSKVFQDQIFNLHVIFKGYAIDQNKKADIRYDVQVYDPDGKATEDKGTGLMGYNGPVVSPNQLLIASEFLKISFTDKYPLGRYKIQVTGHDIISNQMLTAVRYLDLVPFTLSESLTSSKDASKWVMTYAASPSPEKAVDALKHLVQPDLKWVDDNLNTVFFFSQIFSDNRFLMKNISAGFRMFPITDKKRFVLISTITGDSSLEPALSGDPDEKDLREYFKTVKKTVTFPDTKGEIRTALQLDILWAEYFATGKYEPLRKIVSSFALKKYEGSIDKLQSGKPMIVTESMKQEALLEATYRSAVWSLTSNCKQVPQILKFCMFMYENEKLDKIVKDQLGVVLERIQKEKKEARKPDRMDV